MQLRNHYFLFLVLILIPSVVKSIFFGSDCITTTENPLKVHFQDPPLCAACMSIHGAGRLILGHDLSPIRFLLNAGCGLLPPCNIVWSIVSFYFSVTPDRLSCRRLLVCPGDWFDVNKEKRAANENLHQSKELYNILLGKKPYFRSEKESKNDVDETVLAAVRNVTRAFGVTDEKRIDLFADMVLEGTRRVKSAYSYVTGQLAKDRRITG